MARKDPERRFFDLTDSFKRQEQRQAARAAIIDKYTRGASDGRDRTDPSQDRPGATAGNGARAGAQPAAGQGAFAGLSAGFITTAEYRAFIEKAVTWVMPPIPPMPSRGGIIPCGDPACVMCAPQQQGLPGPTRVDPTTLPYSGAFDFAMGEIYAIRRWRVSEGELWSVGVQAVVVPPWHPGVNEAECYAAQCFALPKRAIGDPTGQGRRAVDSTRSHLGNGLTTVTWEDGEQRTYRTDELPRQRIEPHDVPDEFCTCGFYAFSDPQFLNEYETPVLGVVKLTGRVLIGTKGVRAQRAQIVALSLAEQRVSLFRPSYEPVKAGVLAKVAKRYGVPMLDGTDALLEYAPLTKLDDESPSS